VQVPTGQAVHVVAASRHVHFPIRVCVSSLWIDRQRLTVHVAMRVGALIQQGATLQERATARMRLARTGRGGGMGEGEEGEEGVELAREGARN